MSISPQLVLMVGSGSRCVNATGSPEMETGSVVGVGVGEGVFVGVAVGVFVGVDVWVGVKVDVGLGVEDGTAVCSSVSSSADSWLLKAQPIRSQLRNIVVQNSRK